MAEREKLIEVKDLQISFGKGRKKFVAVDHVNFDIYKGPGCSTPRHRTALLCQI